MATHLLLESSKASPTGTKQKIKQSKSKNVVPDSTKEKDLKEKEKTTPKVTPKEVYK